MAGWILGVRQEQSDNWRIGRDAGVWAIPRFRDIQAGDELFFWLSGSGIIAYGRALTNAGEPADYEALPWPDRYRRDEQGNLVRRYSHWFVMQVLKELSEARDQRWNDMVRELGIRAQANSMPVKIPPQGAVVALSWFDPDLSVVEYVQLAASRTIAAQALTVDFMDLPTDLQIVAATDPIVLDPDVLGEAINRHSRAVNLLAAAVRGDGWNPELLTSWFSEKPDLVWTDSDNVFNVAEVKGLTSNNELSQMRLGLGQVLRYRHRAIATYELVQAWLVTDSQPLDQLWGPLCDSLHVRLWWPGKPWPRA
jgi:hypothetical protein